MAKLLLGKPVADAINERSSTDIEKLKARGIIPTLAMVRVGNREDDIAYERGATKRCEKVGVDVKHVVLDEDIIQGDFENEIKKLNNDKNVDGVLIFMPLPKHLDGDAARRTLSPNKDIDGITSESMAGVFTGNGVGFAPCTAQACIEILDYYGIDCKGKKATVIGRSLVVGKPVSMMLMGKNSTVTTCHTKTIDMPTVTKNAEILIVAAGKPGVIGSDYVCENQVVIDVGINFVDGKMCGDSDFNAIEPIVASITPVPGGVGTVTTSVLVNHVVESAIRYR